MEVVESVTAAATTAAVDKATPAATAASSASVMEGEVERAAVDASDRQLQPPPPSVASAASSGGSGSRKRRHDSLSESAEAPSRASAAAGRSSSSSSSSFGARSLARWLVPHPESLAALVDTDAVVPPAPAPHKKSRKSVAATTSEQTEEREKAQLNVDHWLLLTANGALQHIDISRARDVDDESRPAAHLTEPHAALVALLSRLRARVDFQDKDGFSAVHWLLFDALTKPRGDAVRSLDAQGEPRWDTSALQRYQIESKLELLLSESVHAGYTDVRDGTDEETSSTSASKGKSLLDLADAKGNTPLHWAVNALRVDLVGLLLLHGANVELRNAAGQTPIDMVDWDEAGEDDPMQEDGPAAASAAAAASATPHAARRDTSIYCSMSHREERRWGTPDGLRVEQCSYAGESDAAAIRRLIFQRQLFNAVEAGDDGDEVRVRALVEQWEAASASGKRMWPLVYRHDVEMKHPLQIAVAYESQDTAIIKLILRLPHSLHVQSRATEHHALHLAAYLSMHGHIKLLLEAGCEVNLRDVATGNTALYQVSDANAPEDEAAAAFATRIAATAAFLTEHGADPRVCNDQGTDCISAAIYSATRVELVRHLISALPDKKWLSAHINMYGNTCAHYALYQTFESVDHVKQLQLLVEHGVPFDAPKNSMGLTPLQVWAGHASDRAEECAKILGVKLEDVRRLIKPERKKGELKVLMSDVTGGKGKTAVRVCSEYERTNDEPAIFPFEYVNEHVATTPESQVFVESLRPKSERQKQLQQLVDPFEDNVHLIPLSKLEVRETAHRGFGLFATKKIEQENKKGEEFGIELIGELVSKHEAEERNRRYMVLGHFGYTAHVTTDGRHQWNIDTHNKGNISRFIKHSCFPNMKVWQIDRRQVAYPIEDIDAGEELTLDFEMHKDASPHATALCHCGSRKCGGRLV